MNPDRTLVQYYLQQAGRVSDNGIAPIYRTPLVLQRCQEIGSFFGNVILYGSTYSLEGAKALGRETLRTGGKILTYIAENKSTDVKTRDIVSKHVIESINRLRGRGRKGTRTTSTPNKRKRTPSTRNNPPPKKAKLRKPDIFS